MKRVILVLMLAMSCANEPKDLGGVCKAAFAVWGFDVVECKDCFELDNLNTILVIIGDQTIPNHLKAANSGLQIIRLREFDQTVLLHEIGHSLWLTDSLDTSSIMFLQYQPDTLPNSKDLVLAQIISGNRKIKCEIMHDTL